MHRFRIGDCQWIPNRGLPIKRCDLARGERESRCDIAARMRCCTFSPCKEGCEWERSVVVALEGLRNSRGSDASYR